MTWRKAFYLAFLCATNEKQKYFVYAYRDGDTQKILYKFEKANCMPDTSFAYHEEYGW